MSAPRAPGPRRLRVAVVFGGRSAEHEISLLSARFVVSSLDRERFEPVLIGIDKAGRWHVASEANLLAQGRDPRAVRLDGSTAAAHLLPYPPGAAGDPGSDLALGGAARLEVAGAGPLDVDVVFPVLHGPLGEDGTLQGLLALADVPHVGAGVLGSAVGMDKDVMKRLLAQAGLPIVPHVTVRAHAWAREREATLDRALALGAPLFVKPANLGSSVGVSKVVDRAALGAALDEAFTFDEKAVVELGVPGVRELECAVLGDEDPVASRVGEIVVTHEDGFYSYAAKYVDEHGVTTRIPADLTEAEEARVQALSIETFQVLEGHGLARVDFFRSETGEIYVNEVNTLPGFTAISMYPKLWEASGLDGRALTSRLVDVALARGARRRRLRTSV